MMALQTIREFMEGAEEEALALAERVWAKKPEPALIVVPSGPRAWFVLQTVSRGERKAVEALTEAGFETYLPTMRKDVFNRRKRITEAREFLLFNRYLFAELPRSTRDWAQVHAIEEIDCALGANGSPMPIAETEVERFIEAEKEGRFDDTTEAKIKRKEIGRNRRETTAMTFKPGSKVRATSGPFGGFSGLVVDVNGRGAVNTMLDIFARLTPVEFDASMLELA